MWCTLLSLEQQQCPSLSQGLPNGILVVSSGEGEDYTVLLIFVYALLSLSGFFLGLSPRKKSAGLSACLGPVIVNQRQMDKTELATIK